MLITSVSFENLSAQNTTPFWSLAGNSNATATSKLGTTNDVSLRFYSNNVQRMIINSAAGYVGIGIPAPVNILTVKSSGGTPAASWLSGLNSPVFMGFAETVSSEFVLADASGIAGRRAVIQGRRSRGSLASPAVVVNNDYITSFLASAYDGSAFVNPATIDFFVDGNPSSNHVPARISFVTGTNIDDRVERLKVGSNGNFNFNNNQLFIQNSTGSVGIGTTNPGAKLDIQNPDNPFGIYVNNSFTGNDNRKGILCFSVPNPGLGIGIEAHGGVFGGSFYADATNYSGSAAGVTAQANGTAGTRYGLLAQADGGAFVYAVYGIASSGTTVNQGVFGQAVGGDADYGVFGTASGGNSFNAAGYFNGDVYSTTGNFLTSDRKLKTEITSANGTLLQRIMNLKPSYYKFRTEAVGKMQLPAGKQLGLIADELKQVFPELVKQAVYPAEYDKNKTMVYPEVKYDAVNYTGLIPALVGSIQEQQKLLQDQQDQIDELKQMIKQLSADRSINTSINSVTLEQNVPNPLDKFTTIRYSIPRTSKNAQLVITDITGKTIKEVKLNLSSAGNLKFDATGLSNGSYTYSIIIDGKIMQTKKMTVVSPARF